MGIIGLSAPLAASVIVTSFGGINTHGIRPLFCFALTILFLDLILTYKFLGEIHLSDNMVDYGANQESTRVTKKYLALFKCAKHAKGLAIVRFFRDGFQTLLLIFAPLWLVSVKGATPLLLGTG